MFFKSAFFAKKFVFLNFVSSLHYCFMLGAFFQKKIGEPLSKSIFSNFVKPDFDRDYVIVERNATQCFYLAIF